MVEVASGPCLFLQRDPFGYEDSVNLYAGLANDPINRRDPTGAATVDDQECDWVSWEWGSDASGPKTRSCADLYAEKVAAGASWVWRKTIGRSETIQKAEAVAHDVVETQEDRLGYAYIDKAREVRRGGEQYPASEQYIKEQGVRATRTGASTSVAIAFAWRRFLNTVLDAPASVSPAARSVVTEASAAELKLEEAARAARSTRLWAEEAAKDAYERAKAGGRNSGFLKQYERLGPYQLNKAARNIEKQIAEHESTLANPERAIDEWNSLDPRRREHLINVKWPDDMRRQSEQLEIVKGILRRRGGK